jgi:hypothetical protein
LCRGDWRIAEHVERQVSIQLPNPGIQPTAAKSSGGRLMPDRSAHDFSIATVT